MVVGTSEKAVEAFKTVSRRPRTEYFALFMGILA